MSSPAANHIDVLKILDLSDSMEGVSLEAGLCTSRQGSEEADLAYKIEKKIQVSVPTNQLFPGMCPPPPPPHTLYTETSNSPLLILYTDHFTV